jgi:hypothetical protein
VTCDDLFMDDCTSAEPTATPVQAGLRARALRAMRGPGASRACVVRVRAWCLSPAQGLQ